MLYHLFFFSNAAPTTEIYTLSLHDALPILDGLRAWYTIDAHGRANLAGLHRPPEKKEEMRSEEHTSELQSPVHLVCRLLLEKKKSQQVRQNNLRVLR